MATAPLFELNSRENAEHLSAVVQCGDRAAERIGSTLAREGQEALALPGGDQQRLWADSARRLAWEAREGQVEARAVALRGEGG